ncbi:MAG: pyridoxal phosphate-dependent decarboxylase family protein [Thermoanaerobaculia bacterium]
MSDRELLPRAATLALAYRESLRARPVRASATLASLRATLGGPLPDYGRPEGEVLEQLASAAEPGLVASSGPRYFGFVIGGTLPVALASDWLVSAWDQNPGLYATSPAVAVIEETVAAWLLDLLGLPPGSSVGFVTGGQMANFTALAAARHEVLRRTGWNVEEKGLAGAPHVRLIVSEEAHVTILSSLRLLGFGAGTVRRVPADGEGRMRSDALVAALTGGEGPAIVCAQAGNVNTGSFDPFHPIADACAANGAWLHVDGAFGLWAAAAPPLRSLTDGASRADSWAVDAHKWLNVPYDCGVAIVRHAAAHRAAMTSGAAYLIQTAGAERDNFEWVPEFSRRARAVPAYAALRALGRDGVATLVTRGAALARRMAERLQAAPGVAILNDVVLNQVLVRFGDSDERTRAVVSGVQEDGTCWLSGTTWHGRVAMRISVVGASTTEEDADRSVNAILRVARTAS